MKRSSRVLAFFLALLTVLSCFSFSVVADSGGNDGTSKTKRVVSVLYDNSGSMTDPVDVSTGDRTSKNAYAMYALKMLTSLLGSEDELIVTPLNGKNTGDEGVSGPEDCVFVDLSAKDREKAIYNAFNSSSSFLSREPSGMTPGEKPLDTAIRVLRDRGLKDKSSLTNQKEDVEHWLIVLSDGSFTGKNFTSLDAEDLIYSRISNYPTLKTIFISFGKSAPDLSQSQKLVGKYPFTAYVAKSSTGIVDVMQSVANQLSGKYPLEASGYTVSGNKVTVDLERCQYAIKSVSVIAQNCGATLKSVKYNGNAVDISFPCKITTDGIKINNNSAEMKSGYTAVIEGTPYMYGGKLEFEFSTAVSNLAVMVEPALRVETYLEYNDGTAWKRTDMQHINSTMSGGDMIRAGFEVFEQATGKKIEMEDLFGEVISSVTYAGNSYDVGKPFPLVVGNNELLLSVSVLNGTYQIYSSTTCIIEANPNDYRVESKVTDKSKPGELNVEMEYTIFVNNRPVTKDELKRYTTEAVLISPTGATKPLSTSIGSDGKVSTNVKLTSGEHGDYQVKFTVTSEHWLSRSETVSAGFYPENMEIVVKGQDSLSVSQYGIAYNEAPFKFELKSEGEPFDFDSSIIEYRLMVDGIDVTEYATVSGNTLSYVPLADHLGGSVSLGTKKVTLYVDCPAFPQISESKSVDLNIQAIAYVITPLQAGNKTIDRFDIEESNAVIYFKVTRDGVTLPKDELEADLAAGKFSFSDSGLFSWCFWFPTGYTTAIEEINGEPVVAYHVVKDRISILGVNFLSMFITSGDKEIEVEYKGAYAVDAFTVTPSPIFSYIWRILVLILVIYILAWLAGFFIARSLPRGFFVTISLSGNKAKINQEFVNVGLSSKISWHLMRLIPWKIWDDQPDISIEFVTLKVAKNGRLEYHFSEDCVQMQKRAKPALKVLNKYVSDCKLAFKLHGVNGLASVSSPALKTEEMVAVFAPNKKIAEGEWCKISFSTPYGLVRVKTGKITKVIFFEKL